MGKNQSKIKIENKQLIDSYEIFKSRGFPFLPIKFKQAIQPENLNEWAAFGDGLTQLNLTYLGKFAEKYAVYWTCVD